MDNAQPSDQWAPMRLSLRPFATASAFASTALLNIGCAPSAQGQASGPHFELCGSGPRENCIVDGDTFWLDGNKVRIADIDTPEVSQPKCTAEKALGDRATGRLLELLNAGQFQLESIPGRDKDQYGRLLRVVVRDGHSLGDQLVSEGLARTWTGRREPWC